MFVTLEDRTSTNLSSTGNTVNFQNSTCRVMFAQMTFSQKFYVDFVRNFTFLGLQMALDVCSISMYKAYNMMAHSFLRLKTPCPTPLGRLNTW